MILVEDTTSMKEIISSKGNSPHGKNHKLKSKIYVMTL
jgi:hypothetical protein